MNDGGFVPADADTTWARRFGDCKGKTALLLALLRALDIEAQPALVSTTGGDGLDERLPVLESFDHVLVRARIDGKVYWLDGTRLGDRDLDRIPVPNFHWALPVQSSGADLAKLAPPPLVEPQDDSVVKLDASAGLDAPARIHAEHILHGDDAIVMKLAISAVSREDADRYLRDYWRQKIPWADAKTVGFASDDAAGTATLSMDGSATMDWVRNGFVRDFDIGDSNLGLNVSYKREPGPHADAPYAVPYPTYYRWAVVITLPSSGASYELLTGQDVDQTIAGMEYRRHSRVENGVVTMQASQRSLQPEFAASEAESAAVALRQLAATDVDVRAEQPVEIRTADSDLTPRSEPKDALSFARRGAAALNGGDYGAAITDFTQAANLEPDVAKHIYNRGIAHFELGQKDLALADFDQALKLDPNDVFALAGRGEVYLSRADFGSAEKDFATAMRLSPGDNRLAAQIRDAYDKDGGPQGKIQLLGLLADQSSDPDRRARLLNERCWARVTLGQDLDRALIDCGDSLALKPNDPATLDSRGLVKFRLGRFKESIADYDAALSLHPNQADSLYGRGMAKLRSGEATQGAADIAAAKAIDPTIDIRFSGYGLRP